METTSSRVHETRDTGSSPSPPDRVPDRRPWLALGAVALGVLAVSAAHGVFTGLLGLMVGLFAVGWPFPVFRDFPTYAANAESPLYGAGMMAVQGLGQIAVMVGLFLLLIRAAGDRIARMASDSPSRIRAVSGTALLAGGSYFLFYRGLSFLLASPRALPGQVVTVLGVRLVGP